MPELPEVETTVRSLKKEVVGEKILDVWTDWPKTVKFPKDFNLFKNKIKGKKIKKIWRIGKNIIFDLSGNSSLLIHQKMTGHILVGKWELVGAKWEPKEKGSLQDSVNCFIHLMFFLDKGKQLGLSDLRKFAKVMLLEGNKERESEDLKNIGPDPLEKGFNLGKLKELLKNKKGKIKQVLMNQEIISGIGNIYSDEILWEAKINPFRRLENLGDKDIEIIFAAIKKVLKLAIKYKGDSMSDYRLITGGKGRYQEIQKVYRQEGKPCARCGAKIKRMKLAGRSAHFCPRCQE